MIKYRVLAVVLGIAATWAGLALAQPKKNVSAGLHPHLAKAQALSRQAWTQVSDAQQANEWDMAGHAAKAKQLLDEVNNELKMAAEAANKNR